MLLSDTLIEKETITKEEIDELVKNGKLSTTEEKEDTKTKETTKEEK